MRELRGATLWARKTLESQIFLEKPAEWFKIFFCLVQLANHKQNGRFKRGEVLISYAEIAHWTNATKNQIDSFIRWAKEQRMCSTRKTTRGMYVSLLTYDKYQTVKNFKTDTQTETQPKWNRHDKQEWKMKNVNTGLRSQKKQNVDNPVDNSEDLGFIKTN